MENEITHRYEETNGMARITSWYPGDVENMNTRPHKVWQAPVLIEQLPEWLSAIRDVARVGNHMRRNGHPPPDYILWFTTDRDGNLIAFTNLATTNPL